MTPTDKFTTYIEARARLVHKLRTEPDSAKQQTLTEEILILDKQHADGVTIDSSHLNN